MISTIHFGIFLSVTVTVANVLGTDLKDWMAKQAEAGHADRYDGDSWDLTNPIRLVNCIVGRPLFIDLVVVTVYVVTGSKYLHNSFGKVDRQAGSGQLREVSRDSIEYLKQIAVLKDRDFIVRSITVFMLVIIK